MSRRKSYIKKIMDDVRVLNSADDLLKALQGMMVIIDNSDGVEGYHHNGDIAAWGEFEEVEAAFDAIAKATKGTL